MDKLSEYIPIVIILISVVFSIIGKKKKPGNVTQETTLPGEIAGDHRADEKKLPQIEIGSNRKFSEERTKKQVFNRREAVKKNEPVPSFSLDPVSLEIEEEEGMNPPFSFEEEDVRQAIIYAEIINRREY